MTFDIFDELVGCLQLGIEIRIFKGLSDISLVFKKVLKTVENKDRGLGFLKIIFEHVFLTVWADRRLII
ncbi:hypothetical protein BMI76_05465 [Streptococcus sp. 'caviae']|nr:hypothetical protein BMI76_05465 [Streptococcus sp. 'caviae']